MDSKERLSVLEGVLVIATDEGAQLGVVNRVLIDPAAGRLAAITFRPNRMAKEMFVPADKIRSVGYDVILVCQRTDAATFEPAGHPKWRNARDFQGTWVTALDGNHLGTLVDFEIRSEDWTISELRLADGKLLPVRSGEITIGDDEILVPAAYGEAILRTGRTKAGLLARIFGADTVEELAAVLRRGLRGGSRPLKPAMPEKKEPPKSSDGNMHATR